MFLDTWDVESLDFGADGIDEVIISYRLARHFPFNFGVVYSTASREYCVVDNAFVAHQ